MDHLPVDDWQERILAHHREHPVTLITAETGAGKSTRIPWWLWRLGRRVQVTQPRRIAARSLSQYLAHRTGLPWGEAVGYITGFERCCKRTARLRYVTDGVQMLEEIAGHRGYDTLVLDEVHEWNLNQEVLVGLVRRYLDEGVLRRREQRVLIMSATLQARELSHFLRDAPVLEIPGRNHPVTLHHHHASFLLSDIYQLVLEGRNVLVFLPGKGEIEQMRTDLNLLLTKEKVRCELLPLHGELEIEDQNRVFQNFPHPKVVLATDIAQTSLTIDDIDAVVDAGQKKEIQVSRGIEGLVLTDCSQAECQQRAGRAGRVRPGVYLLCSESGPQERPAFPQPEIQRLPLEQVILRLFTWGLDPDQFPFFHPPNRVLVGKAIRHLRTFGALSAQGKDVTDDGRLMAQLPVSIRAARMIIQSRSFRDKALLDQVYRLIAILEMKGISARDADGSGVPPPQEGVPASDLLYQLSLWERARSLKKQISWKKWQQAREIHRELLRRLPPDPDWNQPGGHQAHKTPSWSPLFHVLISGFLDGVYQRYGQDGYLQGEDLRQLDRHSCLRQAPPEWIIGIPFDLTLEREDTVTGNRERVRLPLLGMATAISPEILETVRPFRYRHHLGHTISGNRLEIRECVILGDHILSQHTGEPQWNNPLHRRLVVPAAIDWFLTRGTQLLPRLLEGRSTLELLRQEFPDEPWLSWEELVTRRMRPLLNKTLRTPELTHYFSFQKDLQNLCLHDLLPRERQLFLEQQDWHGVLSGPRGDLPVTYEKGTPYIRMGLPDFDLCPDDFFVLPTGRPCGLILQGRFFTHWKDAIPRLDAWNRRRLFSKRWKTLLLPMDPRDLDRFHFPMPVEAGRGRGGAPLLFFATPTVLDQNLMLRHHHDPQGAAKAWKQEEHTVRTWVSQWKKRHLQESLRSAGWKVR